MIIHSTMFVLVLLALFAALEVAFGLYRRPGVLTMRELGASLLSVGAYLVIRGASFVAVIWALGSLWPGSEDALADVSPWLVLPVYLLLDEYGLYWVHRLSHERPWLWRIHKPHHVPRNMNIAVTYRENWLWDVLVPGTWLAPLVVWLGHPGAYVVGLAFRTLIALMEHSDLRWDLHLQQSRFTRPVMRVLERIVSLPDTHHVHHGVGRFGNAMKNYGATLVCFDWLHGTLMIPHARQEGFGLPEGAPVEPWAEQLFWPFVRSTKDERADRRRLIEQTSPTADLAMAEAVITTVDGRAVVVR
ncbi:sterol desaturase family protein [Sorangium atrum]|uniref:Sterol desaturase family protein n=1 Tax=Sorangium atrum TaxID=2995308 RepID=A0ABT5CBM9_9BACT|nr:sterol desaturase family protein [Sorangium aterium]MDC0683373.1 sterol desaturase family protein [Sorangium aterium]